VTTPNPADPMADQLPGFEPPAPPRSRIEQAVEDTISAYKDANLLRPLDAATAELARYMAHTIEIGVRSRRSTGAALAARELRETLAMLPQPPESNGNRSAWEQLVNDMAAAAERAANVG